MRSIAALPLTLCIFASALGFDDAKEQDVSNQYEFRNFSGEEIDLDSQETWGDEDQTEAGKKKLDQIQETAGRLYAEFKRIQDERRPDFQERAHLLVEVQQARVTLRQAEIRHAIALREITSIDIKKRMIPENLHGPMDAARQNFQRQAEQAEFLAGQAKREFAAREPRITTLNLSLKPSEDRLRQIWNEIEECRQQWLNICKPAFKFARAEYKVLRDVLDRWLVIDGLWPSAFVWASLCAIQMEDYEAASQYLRRADRIRVEVFAAPFEWPTVTAAQAIVARRVGAAEGKPWSNLVKRTEQRLSNLKRDRRSNDWDAYFVLGLLYSEKDAEHGIASRYLTEALSHNKFCLCSQVLLARLKVTSTNKNIRDVQDGLQTLEKLWAKSANKSWRIAADLAKANFLVDQPAKSQQFVAFVKAEAPKADFAKLELEMQQLANSPQAVEDVRQFTDAATQRTLKASVVSVDGNRVRLKRADSGKEVGLRLNQLVDGDQVWLVEHFVQDRDLTRVKDGKKIQAKVMGLDGNKVKLLWKDPKTNQPKKVAVELSQLSSSDQAWIGNKF